MPYRSPHLVRRLVCIALPPIALAVVLAGGRQAPVAVTAAQGRAPAAPADLVLRGGKIVTLEAASPTAEALAVRGDSIVAVGSNAEIQALVGPSTRVIDLGGRLATPGFIESHAHFTGVGQARLNLNLMKTKSWDEIVAMVGDAAKRAKPGEWIRGRGWHQEKWTAVPTPNVEGFPLHDALSQVSPNNPVALTHASGHATFVNAKAMELSGITSSTPNPMGGEILKDARGNPTGLLRERASGLVRGEEGGPRTPAESEASLRRVIQLAQEEALSKGITSVQDAGSPFSTIDVFRKVAEEGQLGVRLWVMVRDSNPSLAANLARYRMVGGAGNHLTVRAIKVTIDGALGSRGAWLLEPYADKADSTGLNTVPPASVAETARLAMQHGYQLCVHAIGDRANRETLDIFEATFKANPDRKDLRWRVEHAQHINAADIPRFGRLGVIASMQGVHATSDAPYVLARLGPARAEEGAYVWQKLMKSGARVINGTDAPVEDIDPIASYYASVSRRLEDGRVFYPDQRMSRMEALRSYTIEAAHAAFEESIKGSLNVGKLADITVLSKDILTMPEHDIPTARVDYTIVGGKVRFERGAQGTSSGR